MRRKLSFSLGQKTTKFMAEVYALKACILQIINRNYINTGTFIFYHIVKLH